MASMANDTIDSMLFEQSATSARPELLVSAVLHLMSHYVAGTERAEGCAKLAAVIERHLKALADLPDLAPVLRATCGQLSEQWSGVVERTMRPAARPSLFMRLVSANRSV